MGQHRDTEEESSAPGCTCTEELRLVQEALSPQPGAAGADGAHSRAPFPAAAPCWAMAMPPAARAGAGALLSRRVCYLPMG